MKMNSNATNMKILLDEPENVGWKVWSRKNFIQHHPTWFFSSFLFFSKFWKIHPTQHFIQHRKFSMSDECICFYFLSLQSLSIASIPFPISLCWMLILSINKRCSCIHNQCFVSRILLIMLSFLFPISDFKGLDKKD